MRNIHKDILIFLQENGIIYTIRSNILYLVDADIEINLEDIHERKSCNNRESS